MQKFGLTLSSRGNSIKRSFSISTSEGRKYLFFELGSLNRKDIDNLKIEDTFVKGIAEIWSDTFFDGK